MKSGGKDNLIKLLKGIFLGAIVGGIAYALTRNTETAVLIMFVMIMSMFISPKQ